MRVYHWESSLVLKIGRAYHYPLELYLRTIKHTDHRPVGCGYPAWTHVTTFIEDSHMNLL